MFTIDISIKDLNVRERNMIKAFFSMNNHQVATPEMMLEDARSYIMFFRESSGKISAYIGIHLLLTGRKLFYSHSSNPFPEQEISSVEEDARIFAEGLGAMLDEVDFTKMDHREKMLWIDTQDIFSAQHEKPEVSVAAEPAIPAPQEPVQARQVTAPPSPQSPEISETEQTPPHVSPAQQIPPAENIQRPVHAVPQQASPAPAVQEEEAAPALPVPTVTAPAPQAKTRQQNAPKIASAGKGEENIEEEYETDATGDSPVSSASRERLEILQSAIKAGIVKPPKPSRKKDTQSASGVVSRDREALARLLTSF